MAGTVLMILCRGDGALRGTLFLTSLLLHFWDDRNVHNVCLGESTLYLLQGFGAYRMPFGNAVGLQEDTGGHAALSLFQFAPVVDANKTTGWEILQNQACVTLVSRGQQSTWVVPHGAFSLPFLSNGSASKWGFYKTSSSYCSPFTSLNFPKPPFLKPGLIRVFLKLCKCNCAIWPFGRIAAHFCGSRSNGNRSPKDSHGVISTPHLQYHLLLQQP